MAQFNYFNYFTEIEEYFWRKRGAHLLVSPVDWAILETWQKADIPLDAVLRGIDRAFESYGRSRRGAAGKPLKSLAYCVDAVLEAATEAQEAAGGTGPAINHSKKETEPFSRAELANFLDDNARKLFAAVDKHGASSPVLRERFAEVAGALEQAKTLLDSSAKLDLEDLERRLTVLEEKLTATLQSGVSTEDMLKVRREMDHALASYRRKMSAEQLALVERQYLQKRLFELYGLSRLSLYYLK